MKKVKDRYIYPAVFSYDEDGISVTYPDLPGCFTCAETTEDALYMAQDALKLHLYGMEEEQEELPQPSDLTNLDANKNEKVVLVEAYMPPFRDAMMNKAVKKTLTIPKWLDQLAVRNKVNFSQVLTEALKVKLGV